MQPCNPPLRLPCLVILVGAPGSGKTTWARANGAGAVHVSQDDLIDAITPHGFDHVYGSIYREAEDAVARAALASGHTVIVDRTNRTRSHRERWLRIATEASCPAIAIVMTTPEAVCRERNAARGDARQLSDERMDRMFAALQPVGADEDFDAIYNGDEITIDQIMQSISMRHSSIERAVFQFRKGAST